MAPYKAASSRSPSPTSSARQAVEGEEEGSMASRKSSEYDIRSISEIRRESQDDVGKWYEEQLSFMRQSIHDEEEDIGHEIRVDAEDFPLEYVEDQLHFLEGKNENAPLVPSLSTGRSIEYFGVEKEEEMKNENGLTGSEVEETKKNSSRGGDEGAETQREDDVRAQQTPIDSLPGSRMLKRPNFGFLSNLANDAVNKAKEAGSQIQAAVPIKSSTSTSNIVNNNVFSSSKSTSSLGARGAAASSSKSPTMPTPHVPMDGLSEEERRQIAAVMAAADFDDAVNNVQQSTIGTFNQSTTNSTSNIPAGMEDLSEEERQKIMAVMASAEMDSGPPSFVPARSPSIMSTSATRPGSSMMPEVPPGMEDLSEEERQKIMAVMAEAEMMQDVRPAPMAARGPPPMPPSTSMIPPGLEGLSEEERLKIMSVMASAEMDASQSVVTSRQPSRSPSVARMMPPMQSMPIIPPGMEGLSEEERQKIMSVMANAEFEESKSQLPSRQPSRSPSFARPVQSMPIIPPGMEDLSEEERQKIMAVMANAEVDELRSQVPSRQPSRSPSVALIPQMPVIPPGLEDLSEEERQKIMSVMAEAEVQNFVPSRSPSSYSMPPPQVIPPGLESLSEEERQKIMSVMAEAEIDSAKMPSRSPSSYGMAAPSQQVIPSVADLEKSLMSEANMGAAQSPSRSPSFYQSAPASMPMVPPGMEDLSEEERQKIMAIMASAEIDDSQQPEPLPRGHSGFAPAGIVDEDELFETERKMREDVERRHQTPMESPTRESGYATSTSFERELGGGEERMDGLLEDIIRIREGARSRRDSRDEIEQHRREQHDEEVRTPDEIQAVHTVVEQERPTDDFDFTYSDSRFADIVKMQEEEEAAASLARKEEEKPRMWETVFDGDESELPQQGFLFNEPAKKTSDFDFPKETDEVFEKPAEIQRIKVTKNHDVEMEEVYDNVQPTPVVKKKPEPPPPSSVVASKPRPIQRAPSKPPPMIKITVEEETKSDSDEESCSEDDEEYPDQVVAAPTAPTPTYEEVENERLRQEEMGKEVLQQIQQMAFSEVANDEFDVQWAKSTASTVPPDVVAVPRRSEPIPIAPSERSRQIEEERAREEAQEEAEFYHHGHNPFLEDLDEDDVAINMEDVEYAEIARLYDNSMNQSMMRASRPVYTIAEDESEDDGTLSNSESRMVAREKRLRNKRTADSLIERIQTMKKVNVKPTTTTTTSSSVTASPAYAIINFSEKKPGAVTTTTDSQMYFESTRPIPREIKDPKKDIPPEISASIDKTMAEVDALLGQVYTNDKAKPNLLCFDQSKFTHQTTTTSTSTDGDMILLMNRTDPSTSPSFLLPLQSSVLGSQLDSVRNENEATSPRGLKRSPGMLLPSPTSSSVFPLPPTAAESVGAAIGATTASMFAGVNISDPPPTLDRLTNAYKWLQNIEDDGNVANNEMGRRKLPSIPPNSSAFPPPATSNVVTTHTSIPSTSSAFVDDYNVTLPSDPIVPESLLKGGSLTRRHHQQQQQQQQQAPVYITSSASRPPSVTGGNLFTDSRPTSSLSMYQNDVILSRPASAASNYTTASTINPTILVGAAYSSKPSSHLRQTVSVRQSGAPSSSTAATSSSIRASVGNSSVTTRVPNTLARVLLKKELKDVLNQRKQRLEATEIEANQRHYKVQKMLVTGLLPEKPDDEIPSIVKCDLPPDLVRGVHISMQPPSPATSSMTPRKYHPTPVKRSTIGSQQSPRGVSKSIACQADETPQVHHHQHHRPTVSLRTQLDMERRPQLMTYVGKRSAETQTEVTNYEPTTPTIRYGSIPRSSRERSASRRYREQQQQIYNQMPQNHNDLLEITKRYFEDYDRQLREFGERARRHSRRRFDFHDDDDQDNMRKAQVMSELARRKERMCASCEVLSTTDPIGSALNPNVPMSSDYSSHIPHYGSLPRIDYPRGTRSDVRDFTFRQQHLPQQPVNYAYNYGSLPRNFERCGLPPIEIENEQSFGAPPRHRSNIGYESTSMFNLSDPAYLGGYEPLPTQQQQPRMYDQLGYAADTTNLNLGQSQGGVRGADMVSQYASYLNSQFQTGLQQSAQLPQPMMPITRYDAPMSDPYMSARRREETLQRSMNPYQTPSQYQNPAQSLNNPYHHTTLLAPKPATMTHVAPTYNQLSQQMAQQQQLSGMAPMDPLMMSRAPPQVYSRNELNYGSRPAQSSLLEYGNRRQFAPGSAPMAPTYDVPTGTADWRNPQGPMQHHMYDARWPKEDALSRMYATASRRRAQDSALTSSNPNKISTGSQNYARRPIRPSSYRNPHTTNSMPDRHAARRHLESGKYDVKRILLTRSYKHHNVYNDLGVRVVGGKRQKNGELSAYVSQLHSSANNQTLGQIKIGDEVVEWNGILLRGKTFEEVERVVNASHGEVEMVIRTEKNTYPGVQYDSQSLNRNINPSRLLRDDLSPDRVPPVPMHRINGINNNSVLHHHTLSDSSCNGHIQVSLGYDGNSRLVAKIIRARGLRSRDQSRNSPNPFVKVYLLPGRKVSHKRRTRFVDSSCAPEWNQVLEYQVAPHTLNTMFLEFTVCDYQREVDDLPLGSVQIPLADKSAINTGPRWYPLQSSSDEPFTRQYGTIPSRMPPPMAHHQSANYSEVPPSILYPKGASRHPDKPVRHATFNYNPVSLDIGYPAIN